jgi:hypothetical protein
MRRRSGGDIGRERKLEARWCLPRPLRHVCGVINFVITTKRHFICQTIAPRPMQCHGGSPLSNSNAVCRDDPSAVRRVNVRLHPAKPQSRCHPADRKPTETIPLGEHQAERIGYNHTVKYWLKNYGWRYVPVFFYMSVSTVSELNKRHSSWGFLVFLWIISLGLVTAYNARVYYLNEERPWPWDFDGWTQWRRWHAGRCIK